MQVFIGLKADLKPGKAKKAAGRFISAAFYGLVVDCGRGFEADLQSLKKVHVTCLRF